MPRISVSTDIGVPREELWNFVNDFDRMTEWVTFADELTYLSDGEIGEGTVYREYGGVGPISSESEWEITRFEPLERQVHVGDLGIMQPELTMTFEEFDDGTRFTQSMEFKAFPRVRPLGWVLEQLFIKRSLRSGLRETQDKLKRLVESEG
jgi:carbon monoxide dehydrogenase subunit G